MTSKNLLNQLKTKITERHFEETVLFIIVGVAAAVICSFYARLFTWIENSSIHFFSTHHLYLFVYAPSAMVSSYFLVRWFAPGSSGSGIPQVMVCIENSYHHLSSIFLRKSVIIIKILSSLVAISAGAAIGREGPSLQISACIAHNIGRIFKKFNFNIREDQLLIAGAASGLAAAFNTPIGGIIYAVEELSKEHIRTFKDSLLLAVVISGLTAQTINGNYLYLGYPAVTKFTGLQTLSLIAVIAFFCGILGSCFSKLLIFLSRWRSNQTLLVQVIILILVGLILAITFVCLGQNHIFSGKESILNVLFSTNEIPFYESATRFLAPIMTSMTGIAGGIFAPSLSAGATLGGYAADMINPELRVIFGLTGMIGFLTGVTHSPITSFILVLEMTDRHSAIFPMMIAAVFSSGGTHLISKESYYEVVLKEIKSKESNSI